ncbi:hypothetical protein [Synechococcus sp. N32]|uniref:hypothetical protein n=1 Tax=Synechococcus sp. N32 TaxID=2575514 RepID=UPI0010BDC256|nr:hypothetical protein [Synechococcus sp. N32]
MKDAMPKTCLLLRKLTSQLFLAMACLWQLPAYGSVDSVRLTCTRVGYQGSQQSETWIISQSLGAVSRVRERDAQPRLIETTKMKGIEILAKEIRGWDPASGSRFQVLLEDKLIILEGYFLDCQRD